MFLVVLETVQELTVIYVRSYNKPETFNSSGRLLLLNMFNLFCSILSINVKLYRIMMKYAKHSAFCFFRSNSCIVGAFTNIEKSNTQIARPGTATFRLYKFLYRAGSAGIVPATPSATVERSPTAPIVPSSSV